MLRPSRRRGATGFFSEQPLSTSAYPKNGNKLESVDVGGNGDCGFRSAAAAMIDNVLMKPRANQELAKRLLEIHDLYFSSQQSALGLMTHNARIKKLIEIPAARAKFLQEMAFALRQVAVDEICAYPATYRGAFVGQNEGTSPKYMRQSTTWIDESAIAALAKAMNITIEVQVVSKGKELPMRFQYHVESKNSIGSPIVLQLQGAHYVARLNEPNNFRAIAALKTESSLPKIKAVDRPLEEIHADIKKADEALLNLFTDTSKRLHSMIEANEIAKDDLIEIYIHGMKSSDYLQGRIKYAGLEHGNQNFFEEIERARFGNKNKTVYFPQQSHEDLIIQELIHAISRAVSIGQLKPAAVFEFQETKNLRPYSH